MSFRRISVRTPGGVYPAVFGFGMRWPTLSEELRKKKPLGRVHLVADARVWEIHGQAASRSLHEAGFAFGLSLVAPGEASKRSTELERLWRDLALSGADRDSCVVALGGGVVGDLAGFASATYLRGVDFIQVPTTLLSMVDASVGGKTGIDLPEGKNLVGAFHQPRAVILDLEFLETLPAREFRSGWAEVVKTAAIRDGALFETLETAVPDPAAWEGTRLLDVIEASVAVKASVVERDEREGGLRRILNFGHTLAHGIEAASRYEGILHGEAVAIGMAFAGRLGERVGVSAPGTADRIEGCLRRYGLPVRAGSLDRGAVLEAMDRDKKRGPAGIRWVLLRRLGESCVLDGVSAALVEEVLGDFLDGAS